MAFEIVLDITGRVERSNLISNQEENLKAFQAAFEQHIILTEVRGQSVVWNPIASLVAFNDLLNR